MYSYYYLIFVCRVLITATCIENFPTELVFFNNFGEDKELGKGTYESMYECLLYTCSNS